MPKLPALPSPMTTVQVADCRILVKRDDQLHPYLSGNKFRKLMGIMNHNGPILTVGGAASNHLLAVAFYGSATGLPTYGIVRGARPAKLNWILARCQQLGMELHFASRSDFAKNSLEDWHQDLELPADTLLVPLGGSSSACFIGMSTCAEEITSQIGKVPDIVVCSVGSGGTLAGLAQALPEATIIGVASVRDAQLPTTIQQLLDTQNSTVNNWKLLQNFHQGGIGKYHPSLVNTINLAWREHQLPLDPIYNGKSWQALVQLIAQGYFPKGSTIVYLHTGGLHGGIVFQERFGEKLDYVDELESTLDIT